jgi:DNA polymerase III subunit chi
VATVQFYHLTISPLDRALPRLLEKVIASNHRVLLVEGADDVREHLNSVMWTYSTQSFLPHGSVNEAQPEAQPILLSGSQNNNLNNADVLMITDGSVAIAPENFAKVLDMFDGSNPTALEKARARWKQYKDAGHTLSYLRQTEAGGWEQKAA